MQTIQAVFFDLDGTLVDSLPALYEGIRRWGAEMHFPDPGQERVGDMIGAGVRVLSVRIMAWWRKQGVDVDALSVDDVLMGFVKHWDDVGHSAVRPYPGVFEGIRELRGRGIKTVLVTNKLRALTISLLQEKGELDAFDAVVTGSDCDRLKPYPDMIERALALAATAPEHALMVGDSRNDALAARAAGVMAALVLTGYNEGEPMQAWAEKNCFPLVYPDAAAVCRAVLEGRIERRCISAT